MPTDKIVDGDKETWAATARNTAPILEVLKRVLPPSGTVLEIASGTGQHAAHFAPALPGVIWQPSEANENHHKSIRAWVGEGAAPNLRDPLSLNVLERPWPVEVDPPVPPVTAVVNVNMIHIAPWRVCEALLDGAARILPPDGILYLYGPYRLGGQFRSEGDAAFDVDLKSRNPEWGIRNVEDVTDAAQARGLDPVEQIEMPANNLSLVFKRLPAQD